MISSLIRTLAMAQGETPAAAATEAAAADALPKDALVHGGSYWLPRDGASFTDSVDWLFYGILGLTIFCFVAITIAVVYFSWRYRARPGHTAEKSSAHSDSLEITWTIIPSIICVFIFVWGWQGFSDLQTTPTNVMDVQVTAQKWQWLFKHEGLDIQVESLHVPVEQPVRMVMRSEDVLHSFFVPAFRTKQDVIPYRYSYAWFEPSKPGVYRMYCAEYCGTGHSAMKTVAVVHGKGEKKCTADMPADAKCCDLKRDPLGEHCSYDQWVGSYQETVIMSKSPAERGEFFYSQLGCKNCHSIDGANGKGPSFQGIWGASRDTNKGTVVVDENYIRESILEPQAKLRAGFGPIMPTFAGKLNDDQIGWIIDYLKTLK